MKTTLMLALTGLVLASGLSIAPLATLAGTPQNAEGPSPADVLRSLVAALDGVEAVEYVAREVSEDRQLTTRVVATASPFRYRVEELDAPAGLVPNIAVSDGTTTRAIINGELEEAPTFLWDGVMMVTIMAGTSAVNRTHKPFVDRAFIETAIDSGDLFYAGVDDIDGDLCHVVLYLRNVRSREDFHTATYYWISIATGLPRATQGLRRIRGQTRLAPQYIISDIRLDPPVDEATFELDPGTLDQQGSSTQERTPGSAVGTPTKASATDPYAETMAGGRAAKAEAAASSRGFETLIGRELPSLDLRGLDHTPFDLSPLRGKPFVLNFWAPWCGPCRGELPILHELRQRYRGELEVLAVAVQDSRIRVRQYVAEHPELSLLWATDPDMQAASSRLETQLGIGGIPVTIFVDGDGKVADAWFGFVTGDELRRRITSLVNAGG